MTDNIFNEVHQSMKLIIQRWKEEKRVLQGAQVRIAELNALIQEGQDELAAFTLRSGNRVDPVPPEAI